MNANGQLRPKFHFTPGSGWMNDPNGLIYEAATGLYHLFFQYCLTLDEDQTQKWWGHAVSHDLMHWTELTGDRAGRTGRRLVGLLCLRRGQYFRSV